MVGLLVLDLRLLLPLKKSRLSGGVDHVDAVLDLHWRQASIVLLLNFFMKAWNSFPAGVSRGIRHPPFFPRAM